MRRKEEIRRLECPARELFPQSVTWQFDRFAAKLQEVLSENALGGEWTWNPETKRFECKWEDRTTIDGDLVIVRHFATLDPQADLSIEIAALIEEKARFHRKATRMFQAAAAGLTPSPA